MPDPTDRRYRERLAGSTLASFLLHLVLAALLFAVVANSSQEGASESVIGAQIVTVQQRTPALAQVQPAVPHPAAPQPFAPRIAPPQHPPLVQPARQPIPPSRHELAKIVASAPPNPPPVPQASVQPAPQPTQPVVEPHPAMNVAAVPVSLPTASAVAVTLKFPPTAAPSPVPTSAPTARPTQRPPSPTAAPSQPPATPAPVASATAAPTAAPAAPAAKRSPTPQASALPAARASASPAKNAGVPSPGPTSAAVPAKTAGKAARPGPKGQASPGPRAGNAPGKAKPGPSRAVNLPPSPSPRAGHGTSSKPSIDLNARLRAMLPHNAVHPEFKQYVPPVSLRGRLVPTPPPEVVAQTKFRLTETGSGSENRIEMWVASVRHEGPLTLCTGWLLRFPHAARQNPGGANGTQISIFGGRTKAPLAPFDEGLNPIVEPNATVTCNERRLTPFSPASSSP